MKWKDVFPDPDSVGASEYLVIHETLVGLLADGHRFRPGKEMSAEELETITSTLEEFRAHASKLLVACGPKSPQKVVVHVEGGVATVVEWPADVTVEVRDYDTEGCDPKDLESDGSVVAIYTKEDH